MDFSKFFIDRPIFAAVLSIVIFAAGLISIPLLPVGEYPDVVPPSVVVRTVYPGANPKVIAETVATPLEESIRGVEGLMYMKSVASSDGVLTTTVTFAAEGGQLQLNAFEPVIFASLAEGFEHLTNAARVLAERCVEGIAPDRERLRRNVEQSIGLATVLNPVIGYTAATQVARRALATGRGVADIVLEEGLAGTDQLREALRPDVIAGRSS